MPMPIHIWMCVQLAIVNNAFIAYSFFIHLQYWAFSLCSFIITTKATAITTTATTLTTTTTPTTETAKSHKTGNTWTKNTAYNAITWWFQKRCTTLEHLKLKRDTQTTQFFIPDRPQNSSHWFLYFESIRTGNYCFREADLLVFFTVAKAVTGIHSAPHESVRTADLFMNSKYLGNWRTWTDTLLDETKKKLQGKKRNNLKSMAKKTIDERQRVETKARNGNSKQARNWIAWIIFE